MVWLLLAVFSTSATAKTIYVDDDANGANNGTSWENAYKYLQNALVDAKSSPKPVEIRVAQGTYRPDEDTLHPNGTGIREATFQLINSVTLKGGYAGYGQPDPNNWNIDLYKTILSGDLDGNDVEVSDPCDLLTEPTRVENSYSVVTGSGNDKTAILDGFIITASNANGSDPAYPDNCGGGMFNEHGSPTITNCTFIANSASICGGGMFNYDRSSPTVINCTFNGNLVEGEGSGMWNGYNSSPTVINCTFRVNSANEIGGGGMYNMTNSSPTVEDCTFIGNSAGSSGGGMVNYDHSSPKVTNCTFSGNSANEFRGGGMVNHTSSNPTVTNCTFSANSADDRGGGMSNSISSPTVTNCTFSGNSAQNGGGMDNYESSPILTNCAFSGNWANNDGGGMFNNYSNPKVNNCTFRGNSSENNGGGMYNYGSGPKVNKCTMADNNAANGLAMACDSYQHRYPRTITMFNCIIWNGSDWLGNNDNSTIRINYSDVQGGWPGEGNLNKDPCFTDPINNDYHLKSQAGRWDANSASWVKDDVTSHCIDAGDPASPIGLEPFPNGGIINMGAYGGTIEASKSYFGEPVCETIVAGDINGDCIVDFKDFAIMAFHWLEEN